MANGNARSRQALNALMGNLDEKKEPKELKKQNEPIELNKKNIEKIIIQQGASSRNQDSYRVNPILFNALKYWTSIAEPNRKKPEIIEEAILKIIPEEYLIQGYEMAKKQNKI